MQIFYTILLILFIVVQSLIALYLLIPFFSLLVYALVRLFRVRSPFQKRPFLTDKQYEFGIIITAHQETEFIFPLVDSLLKQTYPSFYVYVVADDCDTKDLTFSDPRIIVLNPNPPLNAKVKSIHHGITSFIRKHDAVIIFDSDNLVHPSFLQVMNDHFRKGYKVVQADFKPKNTDSNYARMDAVGDMFNFFTEREVRMCIGLSATIWGSGVAFARELYDGIEYRDLLGGFDKKLQAHLVQSVDRIAFAPEAILFDEKISTGQSLETQRTRWIHAYFKYFKESFQIFLKGLKTFDINLLYFGFSLLRPPLFIVLGGAFFFTVFDFFFLPAGFYSWLAVLLSFILSFVAIVAIKGKDLRFIKTILLMPLFVLRQVMALFKMGRAKKSFMKTPHTKLLYIDDLISK